MTGPLAWQTVPSKWHGYPPPYYTLATGNISSLPTEIQDGELTYPCPSHSPLLSLTPIHWNWLPCFPTAGFRLYLLCFNPTPTGLFHNLTECAKVKQYLEIKGMLGTCLWILQDTFPGDGNTSEIIPSVILVLPASMPHISVQLTFFFSTLSQFIHWPQFAWQKKILFTHLAVFSSCLWISSPSCFPLVNCCYFATMSKTLHAPYCTCPTISLE